MILKKHDEIVSTLISHPPSTIHKHVYIEKNHIPHITQIATTEMKPKDCVPTHTHSDMYECFYILEGTLDGKIAETAIHLEKNDFLCVEPLESHTFINTSLTMTKFIYWTSVSNH